VANRPPVRQSELELEGELDGAGAADLVEGVEATIWAAGAEAARQRLRRVAEEGAGQIVIGIAEVGMVKDVEKFRAETKPHLLGEVKLPLQRDIGLCSSETAQHVAAEVPLLPLPSPEPAYLDLATLQHGKTLADYGHAALVKVAEGTRRGIANDAVVNQLSCITPLLRATYAEVRLTPLIAPCG